MILIQEACEMEFVPSMPGMHQKLGLIFFKFLSKQCDWFQSALKLSMSILPSFIDDFTAALAETIKYHLETTLQARRSFFMCLLVIYDLLLTSSG